MSKNELKILFKYINSKIDEIDRNGKKWIGYDGLLNIETFAIITLVLMIFFHTAFVSSISIIIAIIKCITDKKKGRKNEKHDLICAGIGIIFGCIIGLAI